MLTRRRFASTLIALAALGPRRATAASPAGSKPAPADVSLEGPLSREVFQALVGTEFSILLANRAATPLRLLRIEDDPARFGQHFNVVFQASPDVNLVEGTYGITHVTAGTMLMYLRPRGRDERFRYYEAPFNLLPDNAPVMEPPPSREPRRFERPLYTPPGR